MTLFILWMGSVKDRGLLIRTLCLVMFSYHEKNSHFTVQFLCEKRLVALRLQIYLTHFLRYQPNFFFNMMVKCQPWFCSMINPLFQQIIFLLPKKIIKIFKKNNKSKKIAKNLKINQRIKP